LVQTVLLYRVYDVEQEPLAAGFCERRAISISIDSKVSRRVQSYSASRNFLIKVCIASLLSNCPIGLIFFSFLIVFCTCVIASIILLIPSRSVAAIFRFEREFISMAAFVSSVVIINLIAYFSFSSGSEISFKKLIAYIISYEIYFYNITFLDVLYCEY